MPIATTSFKVHLTRLSFIFALIGLLSCTSQKNIQEVPGAYVTIDGTNDGLEHIQKDFKGASRTEGGILVTLESDVLFALNSATLSNPAKKELDKLAALLKDRPETKLQVGGHTDATGPSAFNQTLSENRAKAVKSHLVAKGISASLIQTQGYGSSKPVASNQTAEGRLKNRRVEITILDE